MGTIIKLLLYGLAVVIAAYLLPGVTVDNFWVALVVAVVLLIMNWVVKPILTILTLPITILTLGIFGFVINALIILLTDAVVPGFAVENFWWALLFSLVLSLVRGAFDMLSGQSK